jgi:putative transcriptional regulator
MINHHPSLEMLQEFAEGKAPVSVSVVVSAHVEMCSQCQKRVAAITEALALEAFGVYSSDVGADQAYDFDAVEINLANMEAETRLTTIDSSDAFELQSMAFIDSITSEEPEISSSALSTVTEIDVVGKRVSLPRSLRSILIKDWKGFGKISRARLKLDDGARRTSLLHIAKDGHIPAHTHRGFEITLILQGSFEDELGKYSAGDFMLLDTTHTHTPVTHEGCVCLTVSDNALQFKQGVSQMINPIGKLIY